ncbi:MAG: HAMP domain-containing sensor histidine kinase [Cyanobacteria bacterium P01_D01_bin.56]
MSKAPSQQPLKDNILEFIQKARTAAELVEWLPSAILESFHLQGCQIELYDADQQVATLVGSVGNGWLTSTNESRSIDQVREIYPPLIRGELTSFNSRHSALVEMVSPSLDWLGCPMMFNTQLLGVVWLTRFETDGFTADEQHQLQQLVDYAAIALYQTQLRETVANQQTEIQQLRQAKDEFLQLISHELFVPLGNIQLSTQTLEKIFKDASWRQVPQRRTVLKVLSLLSQECRRQKQFTDNLISLMFPEAQKQSEPMLMDLSSWLPSLLRSFEPRFEQESITFKGIIPKEPLPFECDINQLERIIIELINNALQYTPADKTVTVTVKATDTMVDIAISNTGVHISPEHHTRIFDKFYRIPELNPKQYGGSGLGLAIAKQLVTNLEGTLELKSTKQKTTFTVKLPR